MNSLHFKLLCSCGWNKNPDVLIRVSGLRKTSLLLHSCFLPLCSAVTGLHTCVSISHTHTHFIFLLLSLPITPHISLFFLLVSSLLSCLLPVPSMFSSPSFVSFCPPPSLLCSVRHYQRWQFWCFLPRCIYFCSNSSGHHSIQFNFNSLSCRELH